MAAFLESTRLSEFGPALADLGATTVQDLKDMTPQDYESIGMKKLHMNRMQAALHATRLNNSGFCTKHVIITPVKLTSMPRLGFFQVAQSSGAVTIVFTERGPLTLSALKFSPRMKRWPTPGRLRSN